MCLRSRPSPDDYATDGCLQLTGSTVQVKFQMQINTYIQPLEVNTPFAVFPLVKPAYIPLLWFERVRVAAHCSVYLIGTAMPASLSPRPLTCSRVALCTHGSSDRHVEPREREQDH